MRSCDEFLNTSTLSFCVTYCLLVCNDQTLVRITIYFLVEDRNIPVFLFRFSVTHVLWQLTESHKKEKNNNRNDKMTRNMVHLSIPIQCWTIDRVLNIPYNFQYKLKRKLYLSGRILFANSVWFFLRSENTHVCRRNKHLILCIEPGLTESFIWLVFYVTGLVIFLC